MIAAPRVSIIVPTYNRADLLGETLESLLNQRFPDFEIVVIDDGSTDRTTALLESYRDPRIVVTQQPNLGEAAATNRGWSTARGEYIAVVSSDDPMLPYWLQEMVVTLDRHPEAVVAYPDWQIIDANGRLLQVVRTADYSFRQMMERFRAAPGAGAVIRKTAGDRLEPFREPELQYCADLETWMRLALLGPFVRVPKVLANWRRHGGSITEAVGIELRAKEVIKTAEAFFARPDLPLEIAELRNSSLRNLATDLREAITAADSEGKQGSGASLRSDG